MREQVSWCHLDKSIDFRLQDRGNLHAYFVKVSSLVDLRAIVADVHIDARAVAGARKF
jgi:hypothetical protein